MITVVMLLVICALITTIIAGIGRGPLWVPVLLLVIVHLLTLFPR